MQNPSSFLKILFVVLLLSFGTAGCSDVGVLKKIWRDNSHLIWQYSPERQTIWTGYGNATTPEIEEGTIYYSSGYSWMNQCYVYAVDKLSGKAKWQSPFSVISFKRFGGHIYTMSFREPNRGRPGREHWFISALDQTTGALLWQLPIDKKTFTDPDLLGAGKYVWFGRDRERLFALDPDTGKTIWEKEAHYIADWYIQVRDNELFYINTDYNLVRVDGITGDEKVETKIGKIAERSVFSILGDTLYVPGEGGYLIASDVSGNVLFKEKVGKITSETAQTDKLLIFGIEDEPKQYYMCIFDLATRKTIRRIPERSFIGGAPIIVGNYVLCGGSYGDHFSYAMDLISGKEIWRLKTGPVYGFAVLNDLLYLNAWNKIYAVDKKTGKVQWQFEPGEHHTAGSPVISGNNVYVSAEDGNLYALR